MIHEIPYDDSVLGDAMVFKNTYKQAARIKCATLGWVGAQQLISKEE
jgi:nitrogen fixation NifU-like protein